VDFHHQGFGTSEIRDFGASGFRSSRLLSIGGSELQDFESFLACFLPISNFQTSRLLYPPVHIIQMSPSKAWQVACLGKVHVTLGDIIRPHHVYFFLRNFELRRFVHPHIPLLPIVELPELQSALLLDPTVKLFSFDLQCRSSLGLRSFRFRPSSYLCIPLHQHREVRRASRITLLHLLQI
jgi:hypothetical protein